ncbi:mannan endo-1,4-beta-mannosidase 7-like isoform X2 [Wolffia australiana]
MAKPASLLFPLLLSLLILGLLRDQARAQAPGFVGITGLHFSENGRPFFANGFNAYWLMTVAGDAEGRSKVSAAFREAAAHGLTVCRTWAFSDSGFRALQISPGVYDENVFQSLDFVVAEARRNGIRLVLSFANNYAGFGGKKQFVDWARAQGRSISNDDGFFSDALATTMYKNHVSAVIGRMNRVTGVTYRDDPTILAWELMNEPRCSSDPSGRTLQSWIEEMAAHVKSLDSNHLLEVGLEGFYGASAPPQRHFSLSLNVGTDFISNNLVRGIDFATVHCYPDQWLAGSNEEIQRSFVSGWLSAHLADAKDVLHKPLLVAEFGVSNRQSGFSGSQRDAFFHSVYTEVYSSARFGGAAAGALFWLLLQPSMDLYRDGYEIVFQELPFSTRSIIAEQGMRLKNLA